MIKGILFSKLLKQSLFILLISCFILLGNFSNGLFCSSDYSKTPNYTFDLGESKTINDRQNTSSFILLNNFNFSINNPLYNGNFYFSNNAWTNSYSLQTYLFWAEDGLYYAYGGSNSPTDFSSTVVNQGYIKNFCRVDDINKYCTLSYTSNSSCSSLAGYSVVASGDFYNNIDYSKPDIFKVFASSVNGVNFCFVYTDGGFTICAPFGTNCYGEVNCPYISSNLLTPTNTINPTSIDTSVMVSSPFGGSSDGGDQDNSVIVDNCTYSEIFNFLNLNGYNDYLCYGGLDNFNLYDSTLTYNPVPGSGKSLGQILAYSNSWSTPNDWFVFWNGLYLDKNNSTFNSMWESYPAVYRTWFDLYYRFGGSTLVFDTVREYCAMRQLDVDFDITLYKGQYFKNTCYTIKMNYGTGDFDNAVGVDWDGVGNHVSGSTVSNDPVVFIQNFFGQLKDNFPTRYDLGGGFLPVYIITFLCAIVLFRFLSH